MIPFITKDELASRIIKRIEYAEHNGGYGILSLMPTTKRKYANEKNWHAIGEILFNKFYPWWDICLNSQEKVDYLRTMIKDICEEKWIYYEL